MTYIKSIIEKYPPFETMEEEQKMIKSYLDKGNEKGMRDELVLRNVGLISHIGNSWCGFYTRDEMASYGIEGLIKAAHTFDPSKGVRFSTYAGKAIRTYLQRNKKEKRNKLDEKCVSFDKLIDEDDSDSSKPSEILDATIPEDQRVIKNTLTYVTNKDSVVFFNKFFSAAGLNERLRNIFFDTVIHDKTISELSIKYNVSRHRISYLVSKAKFKIRRFIQNGNAGKLLGIKEPVLSDYEKSYKVNKQILKNGKIVKVVETFNTGIYDWDSYYSATTSYRGAIKEKIMELLKV